ncbi:MAG: glycosyltransferase [Anaerolineales bacterium]
MVQTLGDFEVIAVDDGSTDDTAAILKRWERQDARFRLLPLPHSGIIPAMNTGLDACRADLVARMDADDLMHPERLAQQAAYMDAHPQVDLVSSLITGFPAKSLRKGFRIYIEWLNTLTTNADIHRELYVESPLCHPSVTYRKDIVQKLGGYKENGWAEDYDLWLRMAQTGCTFEKIPQPLLEWREHPQRLTRTDSRYSLENFIRAKAHYLAAGPLDGRDAVLVWGAGMHGRRLSKHLIRAEVPVTAFVDIDPNKIGSTRYGRPILSPEDLPDWWQKAENPAVLASVGARGARQLIREQLLALGLAEGQDWWAAA